MTTFDKTNTPILQLRIVSSVQHMNKFHKNVRHAIAFQQLQLDQLVLMKRICLFFFKQSYTLKLQEKLRTYKN